MTWPAIAYQAASTLIPDDDLPGKVHGIKSLDPPTIQCDGCLMTATHPKATFLVQFSGIVFNLSQTLFPNRRLCPECQTAEGWAADGRGAAR